MTKLSFEIQFDSANELQNSALPVEVRRPNLTLARTGLTSESIDIEPGNYFVTATMPAGQELCDYVKVSEGQPNKAVLKPALEDESPHEWQAQQHYLVAQRSITQKVDDDGLESLGGEDVQAKLRRITGDILNQKYEIVEPQGWKVRYEDDLAEFSVDGINKVQFVQLLQSNSPALNMALPVYEHRDCQLVVIRQPDGRFSFDAHLRNPTADLLLRYSQKSYGEQASLTSQALDAKMMLAQKMQDPISAAVGGYSILRFGKLELLHEWTENLRKLFKWLPDGSAIRGEHLARRGKHNEALSAFLELSDRGLPLFSDGLSYAVDRLRLYTSVKEFFTGNDQAEQARTLFEKLQLFAACTDFREPFTTFTGLIPHEPDDNPVEEVVTIDHGLDLAKMFS